MTPDRDSIVTPATIARQEINDDYRRWRFHTQAYGGVYYASRVALIIGSATVAAKESLVESAASWLAALGITADGSKVPLGLWEGDTENKTVVKHLLADLADRGLDATDGLLVVIDGAKALSRAVRDVFGDAAAIQRCTIHKRRNVAEHLPDAERAAVDRKIVAALNNRDAAAGLRDAKALAGRLARQHPGAAASLREGLDELFTVARLGITGTLAKSLVTSNPIESMISIARTTNRNVKRWRDGQMVLRWTAAGMLNAARSFRRLKGYRQMPQLISALHRHAHPTPARRHETVGAAA